MGLIQQKIKEYLHKKKEHPKTENEQQIEDYRRVQRQQMKIDMVMANERHHFLYGEENQK